MLLRGGVVLIENHSQGGSFLGAHRVLDWPAVSTGVTDEPAEARIGRGLSWEIASDSQTWGLDPGLPTQGIGLSQPAALVGAVGTCLSFNQLSWKWAGKATHILSRDSKTGRLKGSLLYHSTVALTFPLRSPRGIPCLVAHILSHKRPFSFFQVFPAVCWVPCKMHVCTCLTHTVYARQS